MIRKFSVILLSFISVVTVTSNTFVHPGVLISKTQLDFMKSQTLAGIEPFSSTYQKAKASVWGSLTYTPQGPPSTINCGSYSKPDQGCSTEDTDSEAALTQALLWYISGNQQYATNAINILNSYSTKLKGGHTNSNGPLQAGWATQKFPATAEILFYSNSGWSETEFEAFQNCLTTQFLPALQTATTWDNGNWAMSMLSGKLGIAVVTEDEALFTATLAQLETAIPAYFYNFKEDGTTLKTSPLVSPKWNKQKVFDATTSGICQETCRDLQHAQFGIASCFNGLETAYIQGADLYTPFANRLTTMMEFNTGLIPVGFSSMSPGGVKTKVTNKNACGGTIKVVANPTFEVAYNAYHNRMGYSLPNTLTYLLNTVRKIAYVGGHSALDHTSTFETLHHGNSSQVSPISSVVEDNEEL